MQRKILGGSYRLVDLIDPTNGCITDLYAEGVTFHGPAVVFQPSGLISGGTWGGTFESVAWEVDIPMRKQLAGAIPLIRCTLKDCQFVNVGYAGSNQMINKLLESGFPSGPAVD